LIPGLVDFSKAELLCKKDPIFWKKKIFMQQFQLGVEAFIFA
jgi:hypothetical protein